MKQGWTYKKLKEIGRTQTGTTPSKSVKSFYEGDIPFIRPAELDIDGNGSIEYNSELKLTPEGALKSRKISANSILMCCIGSVGKTGYATKEVTCNQQINTITPYMGFNGRFVYYALMAPSFQNEVKKIANSAKATLAIISKGKWEEMSIPVPPLYEQQSIVDYLDSAFTQIDVLKNNAVRQLAEARALFQSALTQAMQPKPGWQQTEFGNVCYYHKEQAVYRDRKFIGMEHIESGTGVLLGFQDSNEIASSSFGFSKGDVLYGRLRPYLRKIILAEFDGCCSTEIFPIRSNHVEPEFIKYWFLTDEITNKINATSAGCRMPRGNMNEVKRFSFHYPKEKSEQRHITNNLDILSSSIQKLVSISNKTIVECDAMKQALLRQIFE